MRLAQPLVRSVLACFACAVLAGCATTDLRSPNPADPWEPMNRQFHAFNEGVDRVALRPAAKAYSRYTPRWFQAGVGNFFTNLQQPTTIVHQVLQGKPGKAASDLSRFAVNTIFGLGGIIDLATWDGIPLHKEDLGQTLGVWGVPKGPFLMVPMLGPATVRDLPSRVADQYSRPLNWYNIGEARYWALALDLVDTRARLLPLDASLSRAYDRYAFIRDAYLQRIEYLVRDGNVPDEVIEDPEPEELDWDEADDTGEPAATEPPADAAAETTGPGAE
jgi:phospholipid-binding lipoprotein MlaA